MKRDGSGMFTPMTAAGYRLALFTLRYVEQILLNKIEQIFHNVFCWLCSLKAVKNSQSLMSRVPWSIL